MAGGNPSGDDFGTRCACSGQGQQLQRRRHASVARTPRRCHLENQIFSKRCMVMLNALMVLLLAGPAGASTPDWPCWGGPNGNFSVDGEGLPATFADSAPKRLWNANWATTVTPA